MKLRPKLTLYFLLLSLIPLAVVGFLAFDNGRRTIEQNTRSRLVSTTILKAAEYQRWLENNERQLQRLAQRPLVREYAGILIDQAPAEESYQTAHSSLLTDHFASIRKEGASFLELFLLHPQTGRVLAASDPTFEGMFRESEPYFIEGQRATYVDSVRYSLNRGQAVMHVSTPVRDEEGRLLAVLAGQVDLAEMSAIMLQESGLNPSEESYLVNSFNFFVTEPKFGRDYALKKALHTEAVTDCLAGRSDVGLYRDYRDAPVMGAYRWLPEQELCLLTEVDQAEAFQPVYRLRTTLVGMGGLMAAIVVGLGLVFARSLTEPVQQLIEGAGQFGRGNLEHQIPVTGRDELGSLAEAFNTMARQRQQVEQARQEQQTFLESIFQSVELAIFVVDVTEDGDFRFAGLNPTYERLTGLKSGDVQGKRPEGLVPYIPAEVVAAIRANYARCLARGRTIEYEEMIPMGGRDTWWLTKLSPVRNAEERIYRLIGSSTHITERKQMEDELRQARDELELRVQERTAELRRSEEWYRSLAEAARDMIFVINRDDTIQYINSFAANQFGKDPAKLIGRPRRELFSPEFAERQKQNLDQVFETDQMISAEDNVEFPGGKRWLNTYLVPLRNETGEVAAVMGVARDITANKQAEIALRESEERFRRAVTDAPFSIMIHAEDGAVLLISQTWTTLTGYTLADIPTVTAWTEKAYGASMKLVQADIERLYGSTEKVDEGEYVINTAAGQQRTWAFSSAPLGTLSDGRRLVISMAMDVTERKQMEDALAEKVAELARSNQELEQFAYVASHDLQEPLRMVASYLQLLERRYKDKLDADAREFINYAVDGARRMKMLINDLLAYSRVGTRGQPFAPTDCNQVLEQVQLDLGEAIKENRAIITSDDLPTVLADETQLLQLFQNLIGNALKFGNEAPPKIHVGVSRTDGEWTFWVWDNGIGLEPQFAERIFIIFQRLHGKEEYAGTGIGLAICKKIVERHGGRIWVESQPGEGATFYFTIPVINNR